MLAKDKDQIGKVVKVTGQDEDLEVQMTIGKDDQILTYTGEDVEK